MKFYEECKVGNFHEVKKQLENGDADIYLDTGLVSACSGGHLGIVKYLHENKANIFLWNNNPVQIASGRGHLEIVKYLHEQKADLTAQNNLALRMASANGHVHILRYLCENGGNIRDRDDEALKLAVENQELCSIRFLLSKGAPYSKLNPHYKKLFFGLKWFRRWRRIIFLRRLTQVALPLYYSPGFPGAVKGKNELEEFVRKGR